MARDSSGSTGVRVELTDRELLPDLLRFLRAHGCIAYATEDPPVLEALRPQARPDAEAAEIRALIARWSAMHGAGLPQAE
jgi:hypothetical protein